MADGTTIGLGIAGLGMAGALMVRAAAHHPGFRIAAAASPRPGHGRFAGLQADGKREDRPDAETPVGSSVAYTADKTLEIARYLDAQPEVALTYATVGGARQNNSVNKGQIYVRLVPRAARKRGQQEFEANLRTVLPKFHGIVGRVSQIDAGGQSQAPIQLNLSGPELTRLQEISDHALAQIRSVPGLVDLRSSLEGRKPEFVVTSIATWRLVGLSIGAV
jgi:HAE1 family hydrophobic/amphiphilic exporter-1